MHTNLTNMSEHNPDLKGRDQMSGGHLASEPQVLKSLE